MRVCIVISVKVAPDRFTSLLRYKLDWKVSPPLGRTYGYQIWTTSGPDRKESRIHSFTGAVDAITIQSQY